MQALLASETRHPPTQGRWRQGSAPTRGPAVVVIDGFLSLSDRQRFPPFTPLLESFGPRIAAAMPEARIRGFSYNAPGRHYARAHTVVSPLAQAPDLFRGYAPRPGASITYAAYSMGALVATLGLAAWLGAPARASAPFAPAMAPRLFLCQPAFALAPEVEATTLVEGLAAPRTLVQMVVGKDRVLFAVAAALATIRRHGIEARLVVWPRDRFLSYGEEVRGRLETLAIPIHEVAIEKFDPATDDPFLQHCYVPHQPAFLDEFQARLASPSGPVPPGGGPREVSADP